MKFFSYDGKFMQFLSTVADLVWLNMLFIFTSIPIFTVGASLSALDYMCIKMWRNEEGGITKGYFKAFRQNFKKGTILWLVVFFAYAVLGADIWLYFMGVFELPALFMVIVMVIGGLTIVGFTMVFPFQAQFENTIGGTLKNSVLYAVSKLPKVLLMVILQAFPFVAVYVYPQVAPVIIFFAFSIPAYTNVILYNKDFKEIGGIE